jgi:drug/metabolite transporter (DMT)-like permease
LKRIDPFYFTLLRYLAVSLILVTLLIIAEGTKALSCEGKAKWVWLFGSMAFTVYNFLVFLGQKAAGPSGAVLASIMMALMPIISVLVMWVYKKTTPGKFTLGCILVAFLGVSLVITKGDISLLSSTSGNLIPALLILTGVFGWVIYTAVAATQLVAASLYDAQLRPRYRERAGHRGAGHDCRLPESPRRRHRCHHPLGNGLHDRDLRRARDLQLERR